jgi:Ca2+-binding RTX toxin-like protein
MVKARFAGIRGGGIAAGVAVLSASMVGLPTGAGAMGAAGAAVEQASTCMGEPATIVADDGETVGTDGPDVIVGRAGDDEIDPGGGRDLVCALGGWDIVTDGDAARDRIQLGAASDIFVTGPGAKASIDGGAPHSIGRSFADEIVYDGQTGVTVDLRTHSDSRGNELLGMETVVGTPVRDVITGTSAANDLSGRGGPDIIRGLEGDDELEIGRPKQDWPGAARMIGGPGDDDFESKTRGAVVILGGVGDDHLDGGNGPDRLNGGRGADFLLGGGGDDRFRGGDGADRLYAGWGDDIMAGGAGRDIWSNFDSLHGTDGARVTTVRIGAGTVRDRVGGVVFHDRLAGLEVYRGFGDIEHVYGSARRDIVDTGGTEGQLVDLIYGRAGSDRLIAPQHGEIFGGAGSDFCRAEQKHGCER